MANSPLLVVAEVGKELKFLANPPYQEPYHPVTPVNWNSATVSVHITDPTGVVFSLPLVVDGSGLFATRITTATDFVMAGQYKYQVWASYGPGPNQLFKSRIYPLIVEDSVNI